MDLPYDVSYADMTPDQVDAFALLVVTAVRRDPDRYVDHAITPFATPRALMGGGPPSRWRPWARRRWLSSLHERARSVMLEQCRFARALRRPL